MGMTIFWLGVKVRIFEGLGSIISSQPLGCKTTINNMNWVTRASDICIGIWQKVNTCLELVCTFSLK